MDIFYEVNECKDCSHNKVCSICNDKSSLKAAVQSIIKANEKQYSPFLIRLNCSYYGSLSGSLNNKNMIEGKEI